MYIFLVKPHLKNIGIGLILALGFSYGISGLFPFWNALAISSVVAVGLWYRYILKDDTSAPLEKALVESDEVILKQETFIKDQDTVINDLQTKNSEYEELLDSLLVELPCVCGGNTFQGLFSPREENYVECEHCKNTFKITLKYDSILLSEPLEDFDSIIPEIAELTKDLN